MMRTIQNSFNSGLLSPTILGRTDIDKYRNGLEICDNFIPQVQGGVKTRQGLEYIGAYPTGDDVRLIPFVFNSEQSYMLVFTHLKMRIIKDGGFVVYPPGHASAGQIVEIATPYILAQIPDVRFTQIFDTMYFAHPDVVRRKLQRSDHHVWTWSTVVAARPSAPTIASINYSAAPGTNTRMDSYAVTAFDPGVQAESTLSSSAAVIVDNVWPAGARVSISITPLASFSGVYRVYKKQDNTGLWGLIGETEQAIAPAFVDDNIRPSSIRPSLGPVINFVDVDNAPLAVGMYQQRLFLGGHNNGPQTVIASQTAQLDQFDENSPLLDTDALNFTLFSEMSERIMHFVGMDKLIVLTSESEKILSAGGNSPAITPTSVDVRTRSRHGTTAVRPLVIGNEVLFVAKSGRRVMNLFYSLEADGYDVDELMTLNPDLFEGKQITSWAYDEDDKIIWIIASGVLYSLTYDRRQQVWAWATHSSTSGVIPPKYMSVASIKTPTGADVYFALERTIGAGKVYTVEALRSENANPVAPRQVDSYIAKTINPASITVTGLTHLIGARVSGLFYTVAPGGDGTNFDNGTPFEDLLVNASGEIILPVDAVYVVVGLPYVCTLRPVRPEMGSQGQTSQSMFKLINKVTMRVINTRGLEVSVPHNDKKIAVEPKPFIGVQTQKAPNYVTGDIELNVFGSWGKKGQIEIVQKYPLPAHVVALMAEVEYED